jgi:hypothetical protein
MLMSLAQTVIPAAVTFLVGYQGSQTLTSQLRKSIRADLDILDALPADHPSRATITTHVQGQIDTLVHRETRKFTHAGPLGAGFGIAATIAVILLLTATWGAATTAGLYVPEPSSPGEDWTTIAWSAGIAVLCASLAVRAWRGRRSAGAASGYSPAFGVTRTEAGSK